MITQNVYNRVFHIRNGTKTGTGFTIDVDNKQYLVTANHVVDNLSMSDRLEISYGGQWVFIDVVKVGYLNNDVDIAVLRPSTQLSNTARLEPSLEVAVTQDLYFLGFPYGMFMDIGTLNNNFPFAFVKKGIVSALLLDSSNVLRTLYLDGHSNKGFSGGPVVALRDPFRPLSTDNPLKVVAVISGNKSVTQTIYDENNKATSLTYQYNTGIIIAHSIRYALELIEANPIGIEIQGESVQ